MNAAHEQTEDEICIGVVLECLQECQEIASREVTHRSVESLFINVAILQETVEHMRDNLPPKETGNVVFL